LVNFNMPRLKDYIRPNQSYLNYAPAPALMSSSYIINPRDLKQGDEEGGSVATGPPEGSP